MKIWLVGLTLGLLSLGLAQTSFTVQIENVSTAETLITPNGRVAVPLSPGIWVVHQDGMPLFTEGSLDYGHGLEALAEDGNPGHLLMYFSEPMMDSMMDDAMDDTMMDDAMDSMDDTMMDDAMDSMDDTMMDDAMDSMMAHVGVFNTPEGANEPGPLFPGGQYSFSFSAEPGDRLSFATMFVQSNDWFYAPSAQGIALFDSMGQPISGELEVYLWDAGSEVDEVAGVGAHQAPRQMGPNEGEEQGAVVRRVGNILSNGEIIKVTISVEN